MPSSQAASISANAWSRLMPCPKNSGADPTPPKLPQPSATRPPGVTISGIRSDLSGRRPGPTRLLAGLDFERARTASVGVMRHTTIGSDPRSARTVSVLSLGAMRFGTTTDEATSFAILDRYAAAGGNFIDTSNNYLFFVNGTQGGESEALLGRWRASRGIDKEIVIATKAGARPVRPAAGF